MPKYSNIAKNIYVIAWCFRILQYSR